MSSPLPPISAQIYATKYLDKAAGSYTIREMNAESFHRPENPNKLSAEDVARYHKDGSEILIKPPAAGHKNITDPKRSRENPRRLTPREAARLMSFDEEMALLFGHEDGFPQVVSDTQAYRQFGNAVVTKVIEAVGQQIIPVLTRHLQKEGCLIKKGR